MELLEGETLAERLRRGPLAAEAVPVGLEHAGGALGAARARHHPSRPQAGQRLPHAARREAPRLRPGAARARRKRGSRGSDARAPAWSWARRATWRPSRSRATPSARSDLFAVGAILFEMLTGRPAFDGKTIADVIHATVYEQPPALSGSSMIAAVAAAG